MRSTLATLFSYIFMISTAVLIVTTFAVIVIGLRHIFISIDEYEKDIGLQLLKALIAAAILTPVSLYLNQKLEARDKIDEEEI